jgi:GNAT superfamily N-acetyltransferase
MVTIRESTVDEVFGSEHIDALLTEYGQESAIAGLPSPTPHRELYAAMQAGGLTHILAAFDDDRLVGFLVLIVSMNPHYSQRLGVTESFFVASAHRKTGAGLGLLRAAESLAKRLGAVCMLVSAPSWGRLAGVLPHSGYTMTNIVFCKGFT